MYFGRCEARDSAILRGNNTSGRQICKSSKDAMLFSLVYRDRYIYLSIYRVKQNYLSGLYPPWLK